MSDKDITTSIEASDADVTDLKKAHYMTTGVEGTRMAAPVQQQQGGLNSELLNMLKIGKRYANFQGLDRCIQVLDVGLPHQRHCGAMMVKNLTTNTLMCSNCDRIRDPNARPKVINSSMIRLSQKELEECGLAADPLVGKVTVPDPAKEAAKPAKSKRKTDEQIKEIIASPKRTKVKTPNKVSIEMTMEELKNDPDVVKVMLNKTLEAIFELPVSNFREAEAIRVVKERVESFLTKGA